MVVTATPNEALIGRLVPERGPAWQADELVTAAGLRAAFDHDRPFTIGIEEELMLLDPASYGLTPVVDVILERAGDDPRLSRELRKSQIEIITPIAGNAHAAGLSLARTRIDVNRLADGEAVIAAAGTHPTGNDWGALGGARYREIAEEYPAATSGSLPCGLHVHVAVSGADRALAIYNAIRSYLPEIAALAANSPYLDGADTGLASARRTLNDLFHRAGTPPPFADWDAFATYIRWGQRGGMFPDTTHLWWDLRPHPVHGTLELRVADAQTRVDDAIAVAALFQSLVVLLASRYDAGEALGWHAPERIAENAYRAMRYGVRGWMVDLETGEREETRARIMRLLDTIETTAEGLGNGAGLLTARSLVVDNGAERQRYVAEDRGFDGLLAWLAAETAGSAEEVLRRRA